MSLQPFEALCDALAAARPKDKVAVIQAHPAEATVLLRAALDPYASYFTKVPEGEGPSGLSRQQLVDLLDALVRRDTVEIPPLGKWASRLLNKSLNVGVGTGTYNKAVPQNIVPPFPIMLPDETAIDLPWVELQHHLQGKWFCQPDPAGVRCRVLVANGKIYPKSADGVPIIHFKQLEEDLLRCFPDRSISLIGRLACVGRTKREEHYAAFSNLQATPEDIANLRFYVQDVAGPENFRLRQVLPPDVEHLSVEFLTAQPIDYSSDWQRQKAREAGFKKLNLYYAEGAYAPCTASRDFLSVAL